MSRVRVVVLLALALVVCQAQCVAACAAAACAPHDFGSSQTLPPCHRHHNPSGNPNPSPCSHQAAAASAVFQAAPQPWIMAASAVPPGDSLARVPLLIFTAIRTTAASPPLRAVLSSVVLRI